MPYKMIIHLHNADPVVGDVDELPEATDNMIIVNNPRRLDGKDLHYLAEETVTVYWPLERVNFMEIIADIEEEEIIGFVRE